MTLDPGDLLLGPRGRRLCLELALSEARRAGADALTDAVFFAANRLDPGSGTSRVILDAEASGPLPQPSASDVARLIEDLPLAPTTSEMLLEAFATTVDNARYWQEPDGEDVLAATPEVTAALARVAGVLAAAPVTACWTVAVEGRDQWAVTFEDARDRFPGSSVAQRLATWATSAREEKELAGHERPLDPRAPFGGSWWSFPWAGLVHTTGRLGHPGPAGLWLVEDAFNWSSAVVHPVPVPAGARVYEVAGPEAWVELCRRHPLEVAASRRHDWFRATGVDRRWIIPDWSRVAEDVDAVHVTAGGYLTAAGRPLAVDGDRCTVLAGWDPDATYWLTEHARPRGEGETWVRDDDGDWHRQPC